ncbi:MAG TPA: molybdopterin-dependent oxidoreductase, partial [Anaerolineales bacterium]|nr:molybdopterin-dependent oxidoreductase [Anaerolineales bacterium]
MTNMKNEKERETTQVNRRDFLKIGAAATAFGATALTVQKIKTPAINSQKAIASTSLVEEMVKTTCALCPSGCGLEVRVVNGNAVKVDGDPLHPLNQGVCCLRGQASLEMLYSPERIQRPRKQKGQRGSGDWEEISWEEALSFLAEKLKELRSSGRTHSLAVIHGDTRGQFRGLLQQFMKSYGSPNLISNASLAEQVVRQAMFLTQGVNGLPVYDINNANYVMTFGGNLLESSRNV